MKPHATHASTPAVNTWAWAWVGAITLAGMGHLQAQPHAPDTLVFCSEASPEFFAPSISNTATSFDANQPIYDTLVRYMRGGTRITPGLAERWEISRDGTQYTFFLRRGVQWHRNAHFVPQREFNADDVLFMINRQREASHPFHHVTSRTHTYFNAMGTGDIIQSVDKLEDYTVRFTLKQASTPFLPMLAHPFTGIQSHDYAMALLEQGTPGILDTAPLGTGPFAFVDYELNHRIRYQAFDGYYRGRPKIDHLEFLITPNADKRWQHVQSGRCHLMPHPNPADLGAMRQHPSVTVMQQPGLNVGFLAYNTQKPPLNDVRVRQALSVAINKAAIVQAVFQGTGVEAVNPIPPTMWSYNKNLPNDVHDPEAAKQLLAQAGHPEGFEIDLWTMPITRGYNPNPTLMAQMIQADLAQIGVRTTIKTYDWVDYFQRMTRGEHSMGLLGWSGANGDPDYFFYNLLSCEAAKAGGANVAKFCNSAYDKLVMEARRIANPMQRIPLYKEAQRIVKEHMPMLTIAHGMQTVVHRNEVTHFWASPFELHDFYGVELTP